MTLVSHDFPYPNPASHASLSTNHKKFGIIVNIHNPNNIKILALIFYKDNNFFTRKGNFISKLKYHVMNDSEDPCF